MEKPGTRLDTRKLRKTLQEIGSIRKSSLPDKTKQRLKIISWYGKKTIETTCTFFQISRSWFYRILNNFLNQGLKGIMKKPGRPRGTTIPAPFAEEIKRIRKKSPWIGSRRTN